MTPKMKRRAMLGAGVGAVTLAGAGFGVSQALADDATKAAGSPEEAAKALKASFDKESKAVGGWWTGHISVAGKDGKLVTAVDQDADKKVEAWSCNKVPVAAAVLAKVDRGELKIDQTVDVTKDIVIPDGDGMFELDNAYPSKVTLGHVLANLLTVSDDTAVRLCGSVCSGPEINEFLKDKGFKVTSVEPVEGNPNRFYLGPTTAAESHELWQMLLGGKLVSKESADRILAVTRAQIAFTDGIRRNYSSAERTRVSTKAGWLKDSRNEVGVMYDADGAPVVTYAIFGGGQGQDDNFGATHPAVEARAKMGRTFMDVVDKLGGATKLKAPMPKYQPHNGG